MKFFLDTADIDEIKTLNDGGMVDGVTTNPSIIAKSGRDFKEVIKEISKIVTGPVSAEVTATDYATMIKEAEILRKLGDNIAIKLPLTFDGLKACKVLSSERTMTNVTLCFSPMQAVLAAKAGASFISPFVGRLDDISSDGMDLIAKIVQIYGNYDFTTEVLVASVRSPDHVLSSALIGADVVTIPTKILRQFYDHPLTKNGLDAFVADINKAGIKVL
ncbi:MAG: putative transaldolase [Alphaproteobacteria bacterium ADurb.Bin438]|nr:MAG: putative transaldolase [Alphaproteobacteria bacterium ADurb.Bin438]